LDKFYKNNLELYNPSNFNELSDRINSILPHPLSLNDINDLVTDVCKQKGISVHDAVTTGVIYELISAFIKGS
jgi:hypothetical protein